MWPFKELRAEGTQNNNNYILEDALVNAVFDDTAMTREIALQIPMISGAIDLISNVIAGTPIKLYSEKDGQTEELKDDTRTILLNKDTGDTLSANEFWKAITRDYFLGKGGYAYINKARGKVKSLHYIENTNISILKNIDPIFKDFDILVQGTKYKSFDFIKILRNTKDGATGISILEENPKLIETAYESLKFEINLVKRGGNKKGFLKSEGRLSDAAFKALKEAFSRLYSNNSANMVVLNKGIDFKESGNTSVEMQLNENKKSNSDDFAKIFHVSTKAASGELEKDGATSIAKLAAIPLMNTIESALNKELLLEEEKKSTYFAFDKKELLKGEITERFNAYKTALDGNFMQIDEIRNIENLKPLGLTWIKLGLQDVLYDPETKEVYTPNTDKTTQIGHNTLKTLDSSDKLEERAKQPRDKNGKFASSDAGSIKSSLIGTTTSDGRKITGVEQHAIDKIAQREVRINNVKNSLKKSKPIKGNKNNRSIYQYDRTKVVIGTQNKEKGRIITVIVKDGDKNGKGASKNREKGNNRNKRSKKEI